MRAHCGRAHPLGVPSRINVRNLLHPAVHNLRHLHPVKLYFVRCDSYIGFPAHNHNQLLFPAVELLEDQGASRAYHYSHGDKGWQQARDTECGVGPRRYLRARWPHTLRLYTDSGRDICQLSQFDRGVRAYFQDGGEGYG